ncbi:MAG: DUF2752 domain-containing protein [Akkermansiaceae bacterium]|nr:DUF2752 domain-containing protein [Akkermansiaceae bacterium]MCF7732477.1 DUF2752 domain-containing protein [Akkermansiaceae bacterium]
MRPERALLSVLGVLVLAVALWWLRAQGAGAPWLPGCSFHRLTGLHCPGCGMTRAMAAILRGDLAAAFRCNPVGLVLLPLALVGLLPEWLGWVRGRRLAFRWHPGARGAWLLVGLIIAFWILRNLPWWPFTLLAPPALGS